LETETYHAIVCKSIDYRDNDKLVSLYTLERGKVFAALKGVKKTGAKLRCAAEPFCFGEFTVAGRGSGESAGHVITGCSVTEFFFDLTADFDKYCAGNAVLEILDTAGLFDESNKELFFAALDALKNLTYTEIDKRVLLLRYITRVLAASGYKLPGEQTDYTEGFAPARAGVYNTLRLIGGQPDGTLENLRFPDAVFRDTLHWAGEYLSYLFGRKLKSMAGFIDKI